MKYILILISALSFQAYAASQDFCNGRVLKTLSSYYPNLEKEYFDSHVRKSLLKLHLNDVNKRHIYTQWGSLDGSSDCKVWPAHPELALIVVKVELPPYHKGQQETDYEFEFFVVSVKTGGILNHYIDPDKIYSGTMRQGDIKLDTAYYKLDDKTIAFGMRVNEYLASSSFNSGHWKNLSLYVLTNNSLKKIVNSLTIEHFGGEHNGGRSGLKPEDFYGEFSSKKKSIIIKENSTNGYADLLVKNKLYQYTEKGDRKFDEKRSQNSYTLKYNGQVYVLPDEL